MKTLFFKRLSMAGFAMLCLIFISGKCWSQTTVDANFTGDPVMKMLQGKLAPDAFKTNMASFVHSDDVNDYYAIDFTKLGSRYEQVYMLLNVYQLNYMTSISSVLESGVMWFSAKRHFNKDKQTVIKDIEQLRKQANDAFNTTNADQRRLWLIENDKFANTK